MTQTNLKFSLRMQKGREHTHTAPRMQAGLKTATAGITGGFAPPTPSAIFTMASTPSNDIHVTAAVRPDGTPTLQDAAPKSLSTADSKTLTQLNELQAILRSIPESNEYGMDTALAYRSNDLRWLNRNASQGCETGSTFKKQASAEEKAKFKRAVELVETLAGEAK